MDTNTVRDRDDDESSEGQLRQSAKDKKILRSATKWHLMLLGVSCVFAVALTASPSTAGLGFNPWKPANLGTPMPCPDNPAAGAYQVLIFSDADGKGRCFSLDPGLYPDKWFLGLPDNWMSSIQVGQNVRARLFKDSVYRGGEPLTICATRDLHKCSGIDEFDDNVILDEKVVNLEKHGWNETVSSLRVELINRDPRCSDVRTGEEIGLYSKVDCVVLPVKRFYEEIDPLTHSIRTYRFGLAAYPMAEIMGIADNSIAFMSFPQYPKDPPLWICLYTEPGFVLGHDYPHDYPGLWKFPGGTFGVPSGISSLSITDMGVLSVVAEATPATRRTRGGCEWFLPQ